MKRITKLLLTTMLLVLMFGMTSQAAVKSVSITAPSKKSSITVYRTGKNVSKKIKATVKTTSKKDSKALTYKSSNPDVVSVNAKGKITCKKAGTAKITVASKANAKKKDTIKIKVVQRATKLTATTNGYEIKNKKTLTLTKGKSATVKIAAAPAGASNKVTWKTSNKKVVAVKNGKITAKKTGKAKITATAKDGSKKKITFTVKVVKGKVTSVAVDKANVALEVGGTETVKATVKTSGKNASKTVGWTSKNEKVATVKNGVITAVGAGETTVTVTAVDGSKKKATVKVVVKAKEEPKPADPKPADPKPADPKPVQPVVNTKTFTVNEAAFVNGYTLTADKTIAWKDADKALKALNEMTKDMGYVPARLTSGIAVVVNGKNYTLKFANGTYTLTNEADTNIMDKLLDKTAGKVVFAQKLTAAQVEEMLNKTLKAKAVLAVDKRTYDFGAGTITVNGEKFEVSKFAVVAGDIVATVNGAEIKAEMTAYNTVVVTSNQSLDKNVKAVEAMLKGAFECK